MSRRKGDEEARKRVLESSDEPLSESRITLNITEHKHGRESNREGGRKREEEKKSRRGKKGSKKSEKRMNNGWN